MNTMARKPSLTLKRRLKARPASVWRAWTEPDRIMRWWGTEGAETLAAETDVRVGGRFDIAFRTPDGERHDVGGVYSEVVENEKLVFSWAWRTTPERESRVTIALKADGDGTILTLTHEMFFDEKARDDHRGGWSEALDRLEAAVG
jgi:uncharacterized protein YndB with AHSA1/START domain